MNITRRNALAGLAGVGGMLLRRAEAEVTPAMVTLRPEIEPLARLIETTPREKCAEMAVEQMRRGVSYRQMLGALFLAGVRNVNPRPPGFAMHCVFVIHSAHLLGLEAPADSRMLPLFYALDNFKASQDRDARQQGGDYTMRELTGAVPAGDKAGAELEAAMEAWDQERAERAAASLARNRGSAEAFGLLWKHGARDYRNIGHKAIYVANACRTLEAIGWQHAEPVLRSVVLGLLDFGKERKVDGYAFEDQSYTGNAQRVKASFAKLPATWASGESDAAAVRSLVEAMRTSGPEDACAEAMKRLLAGTANAAAIWDAVHLEAAELAMRGPAGATIQGLHAVSSANGLHHAYLVCADAPTRLLLALQGVGWAGQFRKLVESRADRQRAFSVMELKAAESATVEGVFAGLGKKWDESAAGVMRLAESVEGRQAFLAAALRNTVGKADEVHYYKYLTAVMEDSSLVSPQWRPRVLAASVYYLKATDAKEPQWAARAKAAMGKS